MTAVNIVRRDDMVRVYTDGLWYPRNSFPALTSKPFTVPHMPAVIATRGYHGAAHIFGTLFTKLYADFDRLIAKLPGNFEAIDLAFRHHTGEPDNPAVMRTDVVIVGWSAERARCESYLICSYDIPGALPAFTLRELADVAFGPSPTARVELKINPAMDEKRLHQAMVEAMEEQRREFPLIGGFVQETVLTETAITQRVVHRW